MSRQTPRPARGADDRRALARVAGAGLRAVFLLTLALIASVGAAADPAVADPLGAAAAGRPAEAVADTPADAVADGPAAARATQPPFKGTIHAITPQMKAMMRQSGSWKPGCPVRFGDLRLLKLSYWGFDKRAHKGKLVVHRTWAKRLVTVFRKLYKARFPIRRMKLIDEYGAKDRRSMNADNTSAFNGRYVSGTTRWSMHAYGLAIDINPVENPYVSGSYVSPKAGAKYMDRSRKAKGMIHSGDVVVRAFRSIGWKWGGDWPGTKDYQHFSSTGG